MRKIVLNTIIAIALGLGVVLIIQLVVRKQNVIEPFRTFSDVVLFKALVFVIGLYLFNILRLFITLKMMGYKLRFREVMENILLGNFFSAITPFALGGQPFQVMHLSKLGMKSYEATNIIASRTLTGLFTTLAIDLLFFKRVLRIIPRGTIGAAMVYIGFTIGVAVALFAVIAFINLSWIRWISGTIGKLFHLKGKNFNRQVEEWSSSLKDSVNYLWSEKWYVMLTDTTLSIFYILVQPYLLFMLMNHSVKVPLSYLDFFGLVVMLNTICYYTPTPGASGGVEGIFHVVFKEIVGSSVAISSIFVWRMLTFYLPIFVGLILLWRMKRWENVLEEREG